GLLGQPVQMASLKGGWSILSPTLTVQGLTVGGGEGLQIEQLEAELDIGASAFWQQPVFRRIAVSGVRLQLQQRQPRQWQLAPGWGPGRKLNVMLPPLRALPVSGQPGCNGWSYNNPSACMTGRSAARIRSTPPIPCVLTIYSGVTVAASMKSTVRLTGAVMNWPVSACRVPCKGRDGPCNTSMVNCSWELSRRTGSAGCRMSCLPGWGLMHCVPVPAAG